MNDSTNRCKNAKSYFVFTFQITFLKCFLIYKKCERMLK